MAKKKAAKKAPKKTVKKAAKPARRKMRPIKRSKPAPSTPEVVTPPVVDVTPQVQESVVEVKPEPAQPPQTTTLSPAESQEKHEELTQALASPPEKKGFWARLFGKK